MVYTCMCVACFRSCEVLKVALPRAFTEKVLHVPAGSSRDGVSEMLQSSVKDTYLQFFRCTCSSSDAESYQELKRHRSFSFDACVETLGNLVR